MRIVVLAAVALHLISVASVANICGDKVGYLAVIEDSAPGILTMQGKKKMPIAYLLVSTKNRHLYFAMTKLIDGPGHAAMARLIERVSRDEIEFIHGAGEASIDRDTGNRNAGTYRIGSLNETSSYAFTSRAEMCRNDSANTKAILLERAPELISARAKTIRYDFLDSSSWHVIPEISAYEKRLREVNPADSFLHRVRNLLTFIMQIPIHNADFDQMFRESLNGSLLFLELLARDRAQYIHHGRDILRASIRTLKTVETLAPGKYLSDRTLERLRDDIEFLWRTREEMVSHPENQVEIRNLGFFEP